MFTIFNYQLFNVRFSSSSIPISPINPSRYRSELYDTESLFWSVCSDGVYVVLPGLPISPWSPMSPLGPGGPLSPSLPGCPGSPVKIKYSCEIIKNMIQIRTCHSVFLNGLRQTTSLLTLALGLGLSSHVNKHYYQLDVITWWSTISRSSVAAVRPLWPWKALLSFSTSETSGPWRGDRKHTCSSQTGRTTHLESYLDGAVQVQISFC